MRFHAAGMLVDGDDGNDDAIFGEMLAVADYYVFDFFQRAGIDADPAGGDWLFTARSAFREFDGLAVFDQQNFFGNASQLMSERSMPEQVTIFAVDRDEIARLDELQDQL